MYALYAMETKLPYLGVGPVPSVMSMYCIPDLVLKTVTDFPSTFDDVAVGGAVERGMFATPSMSAYDAVGFENVAAAATPAAAVRHARAMAPLLPCLPE
jgi:hypothetical protein